MQPHDTLDIVLVDSPTISEINETFLHHQGSTDVITFDYRDETTLPQEENPVSGEIFVCLEVANDAAARHGTTFSEEVVLYCAHGMLHLAGLDDHSAADRAKMRSAEARVMAALRQRFVLTDLFAANAAS